MNKYNIKVGDYVETWDRAIGYVTDTTSNSFSFDLEIDGEKFKHRDGEYYWYPYYLIDKENVFKRIGANNFSKKEIEFKPISKYNSNGIITYTDKLNELIDHINAIQERLSEYDSTRTN